MSKLERQSVTVEIPKFKIDTELSLKVAFERVRNFKFIKNFCNFFLILDGNEENVWTKSSIW